MHGAFFVSKKMIRSRLNGCIENDYELQADMLAL